MHEKGDLVRRPGDEAVGVVTARKERGVAGSDVTYFEWIEVTYQNGIVLRAAPSNFEKVTT